MHPHDLRVLVEVTSLLHFLLTASAVLQSAFVQACDSLLLHLLNLYSKLSL